MHLVRAAGALVAFAAAGCTPPDPAPAPAPAPPAWALFDAYGPFREPARSQLTIAVTQLKAELRGRYPCLQTEQGRVPADHAPQTAAHYTVAIGPGWTRAPDSARDPAGRITFTRGGDVFAIIMPPVTQDGYRGLGIVTSLLTDEGQRTDAIRCRRKHNGWRRLADG